MNKATLSKKEALNFMLFPEHCQFVPNPVAVHISECGSRGTQSFLD